MDSLDLLLRLRNAASGAGPIAADSAALRMLFSALGVETAIILICVAVAVFRLAIRLGKRGSRASRGSAPPLREATEAASIEKLRKQLDEMVARTNERNNYINSIFCSIEDGFMLVDSNDRVALYNPRARDLLGLGPDIFFDAPRDGARITEEVAAILEACGKVTRTREAQRLRLVTSGGAVLDARITPIVDKYRKGADFGSLAMVKDVTGIEKLENMKKDFVATVSHEFRTPLTLISGFMEMLKTVSDIDIEDRKRAFEIVEIETERLKRLVSELLTLSEIENSLPSRASGAIDVGEVLATIARSLGKLAEAKGQRLETKIGVAKGLLRGDEGWFYQAIKNLVENAIKYTPEGGSILIEGDNDESSVVVSVSDNGIGIAEEELDRIFDRFYRVEKSRGSGGGGSGLGLALVKDIASIFGGAVEVRSAPGEGSIFTLRLPIDAKAAGVK